MTATLRARRRTRLSVQPVTLLVPEVEALQVKAKRVAEPGRALNQVLSGENLDRAGVTSMPVTGGRTSHLTLSCGRWPSASLVRMIRRRASSSMRPFRVTAKRRSQIHRISTPAGVNPKRPRCRQGQYTRLTLRERPRRRT